VVLQVGARRESTITLDVGTGGFAAAVGPLAVGVVCEFELGISPEPLRGRARVVASVREASGAYRTSVAIETLTDGDRQRLEVYVIDAVLQTLPA
jgi:hypothetical protein